MGQMLGEPLIVGAQQGRVGGTALGSSFGL